MESNILINKLICPKCYEKLELDQSSLLCSNPNCALEYPIVNGIPILINEDESLFCIEDFLSPKRTTLNLPGGRIKSLVKKCIPSITSSMKTEVNYSKLARLLQSKNETNILIIGGSIKGLGIDKLYDNKNFNIVESDVSHGPYTKLIFDCHSIPYEENVFDAVICQAVMEHVLNPQRCVAEIYRVLKEDGYVYAETPFMQQVHGGAYDFTRFTYLGHRYLFKNFREIESGMTHASATALAWSIRYFMKSFLNNRKYKLIMEVLSSFLFFWIKYFDYILIKRKGSYDAASGFYFLGKKSKNLIDGKELIKIYRGIHNYKI